MTLTCLKQRTASDIRVFYFSSRTIFVFFIFSSLSIMAEPVNKEESKDLHQAINTALENEQGGTQVHVFDPDMSAEAKKAEALKNVNVPEIVKKAPLATDIGTTDNKKVAEALAGTETTVPNPSATVAATPPSKTPGSYVQDPITGLPTWYKVGWTSFSNLPNPGDEKAMTEFAKTHNAQETQQAYYDSRESNSSSQDDDFITQFINEKYYGEWWHNCGVVFVAIFFTWLLIKLRFGLFACLITGAFFGKLSKNFSCVTTHVSLYIFYKYSYLLSYLD